MELEKSYRLYDIHIHYQRRLKRYDEDIKVDIRLKEGDLNRYKTEISSNLIFLNEFTNFGEYGLDKLTNSSLKAIKWKISKIPERLRYKTDRVNLALRRYVDIKDMLAELRKEVIKNQQRKIEVGDFIFMCRAFNEFMVDEIIKNAYVFNMPYQLGDICIKRYKSKRPKVNWKATQLYKAKLLKDGETLYNQDTAPHGKKWIVYFNDEFNYRFDWSKVYSFVTNKMLYTFRPNNSVTGVCYKLFNYIRNNPLVVHKYRVDNIKRTATKK